MWLERGGGEGANKRGNGEVGSCTNCGEHLHSFWSSGSCITIDNGLTVAVQSYSYKVPSNVIIATCVHIQQNPSSKVICTRTLSLKEPKICCFYSSVSKFSS